MATWPTTISAPLLDGLDLKFGENAVYRMAQSGRSESVRYGSGAPDRLNCTLRLWKNLNGVNQVDAFKVFFDADLCLGVNWFAAWWIASGLGYADHKGKIVGYPKVSVDCKLYADFALTIIIKKSSACPVDDTVWPVGA